MIDIYDPKYAPLKEECFDEYCHRLATMRNIDPNVTWVTIAAIVKAYTGVEFTPDKYRKQEKVYQKTGKAGKKIELHKFMNITTKADDFKAETVSYNYKTNETTSYKELPLTKEELTDPDSLLIAHGYDPKTWKLKTAHNNKTVRTTSMGDRYYYSSRITVSPRDGNDITFSDIEDYFDEFNSKKARVIGLRVKPAMYDPEGEFLEVCLQDLHMGLFSYSQETGEDYDIEIAKQRVNNCLSDIYQRCQGRKFKRVVFVLLGDILHTDNYDASTTKGTRQDVDTRPTRVFDEALDTLIQAIYSLGNIAPVEVINLQGNHAKLSEYYLCKSLEMAFTGDPNVTFFNSPNPRKWRRYGKVLLGFAHGDMKPNAVTEWLSNECPEWSSAKYREVHLGHLHSLQTLQKIEDNKYGLIARYLPALCASSAWEHGMGYPKAQRGMMSFVWHEEKGLREVWYSNI